MMRSGSSSCHDFNMVPDLSCSHFCLVNLVNTNRSHASSLVPLLFIVPFFIEGFFTVYVNLFNLVNTNSVLSSLSCSFSFCCLLLSWCLVFVLSPSLLWCLVLLWSLAVGPVLSLLWCLFSYGGAFFVVVALWVSWPWCFFLSLCFCLVLVSILFFVV